MGVTAVATASAQFRQILGIRFFVGDADEAIARISGGGLLVVPAAPALKNLAHDPEYREALQGADLVITDSAFMVMIWNRLKRDSIRRVSGLKYLIFAVEAARLLPAWRELLDHGQRGKRAQKLRVAAAAGD